MSSTPPPNSSSSSSSSGSYSAPSPASDSASLSPSQPSPSARKNPPYQSHAEQRKRRREQQAQQEQNQKPGSNLPQGLKVYGESGKNSDCAVCLMPLLHSTVLPCGHMFCYLCIKGIIRSGSNVCPLCRSAIPDSVIMNPTLYEPLTNTAETDPNEHKWFYRRRRVPGWWQYDERTSSAIETAFNGGEELLEVLICGWWQYDDVTNEVIETAYKNKAEGCSILVAGYNCFINFKSMLQFSKPTKYCREVIREKRSSIKCIGIAGIFCKEALKEHHPPPKKRIQINDEYFLKKIPKYR